MKVCFVKPKTSVSAAHHPEVGNINIALSFVGALKQAAADQDFYEVKAKAAEAVPEGTVLETEGATVLKLALSGLLVASTLMA